MNGRYYDKEQLPKLLDHIRFYERVDLAIKLALPAALFLILLWVNSIWLVVLLLLLFLTVETAAWLVTQLLHYAWKRWFCQAIYDLSAASPPSEKIGRYSLAQVRSWIDELCSKLDLRKPAELVIYESKYANAFASQERWIGLLRQNRIELFSNMFYLLDLDEFRAVIAHELGHHKHFPKVSLITQLLIPALAGRPVYRQCLEYLSDWYAADSVGLIPAANALIKIHHRRHLITEISRGLAFVQKDFNIGITGAIEFQQIAADVIPHDFRATEKLDKHIAEIIDRYFEKRSPALRGTGKDYAAKFRKDPDIKLERQALKFRYKFIDWRIFDNRIKDNTLDEQELEELYLYLKNNQNVQLFSSDVIKDPQLEKWVPHPSLRDRLIFLVEAAAPA